MAAPAPKEETAKHNSSEEEITVANNPLMSSEATSTSKEGTAQQNSSSDEDITVASAPLSAINSGIESQEDRGPQDTVVDILDRGRQREVLKQNLKSGCTLDAYDEVTRLLWIKENEASRTALEEWDRKTELFAARVDRRDKFIADFKNEIYQLVGFFSAFQGLVLTAVTQLTQSTSQKHCGKVWSPVVLSGLAWIVAVVGVGQKFRSIELIETDNRSEKFSRREVAARGLKLRSLGKDFNFSDIKEKETLKKSTSFKSWLPLTLVVLTLSLFTGVFIASYFLILCETGEAYKLD